MWLATGLHEHCVGIEGFAVAAMPTRQTLDVLSTKLDTPEVDSLIADRDTAFCEKIFDISVVLVESVAGPDCVRDDIWWESMPLIGNHRPILPILETQLLSTPQDSRLALFDYISFVRTRLRAARRFIGKHRSLDKKP